MTDPFSKLWECIIIGAGPAGASAAIQLRKLGHEVLLVDKLDFPRDKICGDALIPDAIDCLTRLGIYDTIAAHAHPLSELEIYSPSRYHITVNTPFLTLKRFMLDDLLVKEALKNGAELLNAHIRTIATSGTEVTAVTGTGKELRARTLFIATGSNHGLSRQLPIFTEPTGAAVAGRCYIESPVPYEKLVIAFDKPLLPGYGWIFPLNEGQFNIGCGVTSHKKFKKQPGLKQLFTNFIQGFPLARKLMENGKIITPFTSALLRTNIPGNTFHYKRILVIGETIGTTFPFTGEGIGKAMESGILAAETLHAESQAPAQNKLAAYSQKINIQLKPAYKGYELAEKWLRFPWLNDAIIKKGMHYPKVGDKIKHVLNESDAMENNMKPGKLLKAVGWLIKDRMNRRTPTG